MNTTAPEDAGKNDVKTAVCCSGGGIRSASYCLGALEALTADLDGQQPDLVTGVSGGSYIAAAGAVAADPSSGVVAEAQTIDTGAGYRAGFKAGSLLERRLRNNTHYLVPDFAVGLRGVLSLLWGALGNMFLVGSLVYVISALTGWLLAATGRLTWTQNAVDLRITAWQVWVPAGLGIMAAVSFFLSRLAQKPTEGSSQSWTERWSTWAAASLALAVAATLLLLAAPALFAAIWQSGSQTQPGISNPIPASVAIPIIAAGAAAFAKAAAGTISASWSRLGPGVQGKVRPWLAKAGRAVMPWLGSLFVVAGLLTLSVFIVGISAAPDYQHWQIAAAVGVFVVLHVLMDVNRSSMHDFYRDRLASAYADPARAGSRMSRLTGTPELVICAAANLRTGNPHRTDGALRGIPPGRGAVSCVFTPANVELHFPESGATESARTVTYEDLIRPDRMTLFDLVAISGAAVAPLMGKMTSAAHRLLFGAVNLRLGVWMPRPSLVQILDGRTAQTTAVSPTKWHTLLQEHWRDLLEDEFPGRLDRWMLRWRLASWDRIRYHNQTHPRHSWRSPSCWAAAMMWRFWQPNLLLLWREVAGNNSASAKWIYVSDGGHYENLGLVEALRHPSHPQHIYLVDASGDPEHKYTGLGQAIALARSELGVEITLEPADMERPAAGTSDAQKDTDISGRKPGIIRPFAIGTYHYANDERADQRCEIDIIKLGVWDNSGLPWDVRAYYATHPTFPRDSTLKQLYDDEDFEAYRELGQASMKALLAHRRASLAHRKVLIIQHK